MSAIPDISKLLDAFLLAKRDAEGDRPVAGGMTWRASRLGSCLRSQYLSLHLKQPGEEFDAKSLKRFEVGHAWSRQFAQWFREMGYGVQEEIELIDADLDIGANGDFIIDKLVDGKPVKRVGIELKSIQSKAFWHGAKQKESAVKPEHLIQAAVYDLLMRKQGLTTPECPWIVLAVSKDDLTIDQEPVTEVHRAEAMRRITLLNEAKKTGVPPPCDCMDDWHWRYCSLWGGDMEERRAYNSLSWAKRQKTPVPQGECCVIR